MSLGLKAQHPDEFLLASVPFVVIFASKNHLVKEKRLEC